MCFSLLLAFYGCMSSYLTCFLSIRMCICECGVCMCVYMFECTCIQVYSLFTCNVYRFHS